MTSGFDLAFPRTPIERLLRPFQRFAQMESSGGIVLLITTVVALVWANSPGWEGYRRLWETPVALTVGGHVYGLSLHLLINDGLMVIFFFLVGLEIKREMLVGELASLRAAALPIMAALGGMLAPAAIYALLNARGAGEAGWGIPMATDIAFALGVLALVAPRVPTGLKVFLAALAIADDLGAVLVIAFFYTGRLNVTSLAVAAILVVVLIVANRLGMRHPAAYALLGVPLWLAFLTSGVHATIAGVVLAMVVPARTRIDTAEFLESSRRTLDDFDLAGEEGSGVMTNEGQQAAIQALEHNCEAAQAPLLRMEHSLQPWVAFFIIPLFALANAGVHIDASTGSALTHVVTLGVVLGLVLGKPIGITLFAWLAVRLRVAVLPASVGWRQIHAVSWLGGIGFTMSLFVAGLAFGEGSELLDAAKIGILTASVLAAAAGGVMLHLARDRGHPAEAGPPTPSQ
ncbi:MAG TPA: Na+/H+ antiporter NhaA [Longimicrobiaceae bacterium]|nr:Na+/H+ antiporter NhaA [Longimicrobiaceae bacterium]